MVISNLLQQSEMQEESASPGTHGIDPTDAQVHIESKKNKEILTVEYVCLSGPSTT